MKNVDVMHVWLGTETELSFNLHLLLTNFKGHVRKKKYRNLERNCAELLWQRTGEMGDPCFST